MTGKKGRSGRKRITVNSHNGKAKLDMLVPEAISVIEAAVAAGDVAVSRWVAEMALGKPRQRLEQAGVAQEPIRIIEIRHSPQRFPEPT